MHINFIIKIIYIKNIYIEKKKHFSVQTTAHKKYRYCTLI